MSKRSIRYPYTGTILSLQDAIRLLKDLGCKKESKEVEKILERVERLFNN